MKSNIFYLLILGITACNTNPGSGSTTDTTYSNPSAKIDLARANPKTEAVASYEQPVPNDLNKWFFRVHLYETDKRFTYKMKLEYEEIKGDDKITFPNLGVDPKPVIQKGTKDMECIIGFLNADGKFMPYKKVYIVDDNLKVTTVASYAVTVKPN